MNRDKRLSRVEEIVAKMVNGTLMVGGVLATLAAVPVGFTKYRDLSLPLSLLGASIAVSGAYLYDLDKCPSNDYE